jgi:hypothetical protein
MIHTAEDITNRFDELPELPPEKINHISFTITHCPNVSIRLALGKLRKPNGIKLDGPIRGVFLWLFRLHFQIVWSDFCRVADNVGAGLFTQFLIRK